MLDKATLGLQKAIEHLENEFSKLQLGRANPSLIENIRTETYGMLQPIKNVANISVMDSQTLSIQPWDRSSIHSIAKAITEEGLGLNPQTMADSIIIKFPVLTQERRKEIAKYAKTILEDAKITIRNVRGDELRVIKKAETDKEISEDIAKDFETKLQKLVDEANKKADELYKKKDEDIMKI
ncbi:MAG: ribosome recycling factor [Candidatus Gracilibacteria bacterium]|nr:ribosome recycling factor [Candidatus Gracilibacteria bacterium]